MGRRRKSDNHLPPCVYLKHGAYYYVKNGVWTRLGRDLDGALAEYAKRFEHPRGGMADLMQRVLDRVSPKLSPNTVSQYRIAMKRASEFLVEFAPRQVMPKHIAAIKADMADTPNMANRVISFLRVVFAHAVEWQEVDSNPCLGVMRHVEAKRQRYLTDDEFHAIRAHAHPRLQVVMDLLYLTGQRVGDVLKLKRADLLEKGIAFKQEKTGAQLVVRWKPELRAAVEAAKALSGNVVSPYLFRTRARGGQPPSYGVTKDQWNEAVKAAGVSDAHIHDIRAKALTDAKRQGKDPTALAGHTTATMTDRYIRLREVPEVEGPAFTQTGKKSA